jgi:DNA-binding LytR/AlgR family response regulator
MDTTKLNDNLELYSEASASDSKAVSDNHIPFRGWGERPAITAIIVEDEELPRLALQSKLNTYHPDIQILDMCENCDDALDSILRRRPQLLFLDIQLPGKNSLWLIEQLEKIMPLPHIIFTTAFTDPEYLLKAIKVAAVDYLNKPISIVELAGAIEKMKRRLWSEQPAAQVLTMKPFTFKTYNSILVASCDDIVYCEADGNYTNITLLKGKAELVFERLGEIADRLLCDDNFIRIGRSLIINKKYIHKINTKESTCQLIVNNITHTLAVPHSALSQLKSVVGN